MTGIPDFDDLVGDELGDAERERLRRVHDLLVTAGPPPELSPELAAGPNPFVTRRRAQEQRGWLRNRTSLLAAAALIAIAAFVAGSHSRSGGGGFVAIRTVSLQPTAAAAGASATIQIGKEWNENWPMRLTAAGLPDSTGKQYYAVFLTRNGKVVGPCGWFVVHGGRALASLNAPYKLTGAGWIVTAQKRGDRSLGRIVLRTSI